MNSWPLLFQVNDSTIVGCTGDYADFQWLRQVIEQKQIDEEVNGYGGCETTKPSALYHWLTRFLYNRRSKFDPLWTTVVVGGMQDGAPFLGCVNYIGAAYQESAISTGLGQEIAVPIMRCVRLELVTFTRSSADFLSLKHGRSILRQSSNPVCGLWKSKASSPRAKQHRALPVPS